MRWLALRMRQPLEGLGKGSKRNGKEKGHGNIYFKEAKREKRKRKHPSDCPGIAEEWDFEELNSRILPVSLTRKISTLVYSILGTRWTRCLT